MQVVRDSIRVALSAFHCDEALHAFHDISGIKRQDHSLKTHPRSLVSSLEASLNRSRTTPSRQEARVHIQRGDFRQIEPVLRQEVSVGRHDQKIGSFALFKKVFKPTELIGGLF